MVTASCAEGDTGKVYQGALKFEHTFSEVNELPDVPVKIMMNVVSVSSKVTVFGITHALTVLEFQMARQKI